ncbi:MAG: hypothetical protein CR986_10040 [Ignavibacteriae bacterium]|nr:MAG: hypothetical protein CR986_10040 [Ignavibacteriota bacterium]
MQKRKIIISLFLVLSAILFTTCVEDHVLPSLNTILIKSEPSGAKIYLNGEQQFTDKAKTKPKLTPDSLKNIFDGEHKITLSLQDYRDTTVTAKVSKNSKVTKDVVLTFYEPRGSISLDSEPQGAKIFLDSVDVKLKTPNIISKLPEGNYIITLKLDSYFDTSFTVPVIEDQRTIWDKVTLVKIPYMINVTIKPENTGIVTGSGGYKEGQEVTLKAIPNTGYKFVNWTENGISVSTDSIYIFTANKNRNLTANFAPKLYQISATVNPQGAGVVNGAGSYYYKNQATLNARPNSGYKFVNWTENGNEITTEPTYVFEVTKARNLIANFQEVGNISVSSDPVGANIFLNGESTGKQTPHVFKDLDVGNYSVKLSLIDFADTTLIAKVTKGKTTNLGNVYLRDTTSNVKVKVTYGVNLTTQRIVFTFVFNQDVRFSKVKVAPPNFKAFEWSVNQLLKEGQGTSIGYPLKIVGKWRFECYGTKVRGRQNSFVAKYTLQVK